VTQDSGPIGVFDSGVGGLTVAAEILRRFPGEQILYLADQAHVPYGGRPLREIQGFAVSISRFLAESGCRALVMACNISSAVALERVARDLAPLPVRGMIAAAARCAAAESAPIGVLATEGTVRSGAYTAQITTLNARARVIEIACPRFVPLVQAGELDTPAPREAARERLQHLARAGCRVAILGCTHYPFLLPALRRAAADLEMPPVEWLDPARALVDEMTLTLPGLRACGRPRVRLLTTGRPDAFAAQAARFLPGVEAGVEPAAWVSGGRIETRAPAAACR